MGLDKLSREEYRLFNERNQLFHTKQFNRIFFENFFALTEEIKKGVYDKQLLKDKIVAMLFYEPSTRTRFSFESAITKLGGSVLTTENAAVFSSASKGETIEDTMRMMDIYADITILRTSEDDVPYKAAKASVNPLINAGSGKTQHPTQTLLDLFTIYGHFGTVDGLHIAIVGDLLRSRTVDSLVYVLSKYPKNRLIFVSPENSKIKPSLREHLSEKNITFTEDEDFKQALRECDVCYVTRIQKERFDSEEEYQKEKGRLVLNAPLVKTMKDNAIIMHPLPRVDEITTEVDDLKQAHYFKQAENGLYARIALLTMIEKGGVGQYFHNAPA